MLILYVMDKQVWKWRFLFVQVRHVIKKGVLVGMGMYIALFGVFFFNKVSTEAHILRLNTLASVACTAEKSYITPHIYKLTQTDRPTHTHAHTHGQKTYTAPRINVTCTKPVTSVCESAALCLYCMLCVCVLETVQAKGVR